MSLMSSKEYTHDKELQNMLKEIQHSLSTHLTNILTPIFNEKKDIHDILLNVPMIKKMHIENIELKSMNKLLSDEIHKLKEELSKLMRLNMPTDVRVACPYYKPKNSKVDIVPDYFIHDSEEWLVFPHELSGLTPDEILEGKTDLTNIKDLLF